MPMCRGEGVEKPEHVQSLRAKLEAAETSQISTSDRLEAVEARAAGFLAALEKAQAENATLQDRLGGVEDHHEVSKRRDER